MYIDMVWQYLCQGMCHKFRARTLQSPVLALIPSHVRGTLRTCSAETTEGHGLMSHWQGWPAWTRLLLSEARGQRTNHPKYCPGTFVSLRNHKLLKPWKVSTWTLSLQLTFFLSTMIILLIDYSFLTFFSVTLVPFLTIPNIEIIF